MPKYKTIILNAMFVGDYGEKNMDGEVINFYLDDKGEQHYFLPAYGSIPEDIINDEIEAIIMVYKFDGKSFEIIGKYVPKTGEKIKFVEQALYEENKTNEYAKNITYGGVSLVDIHGSLNPNQKFYYVTFSGGKISKPQKRIIVSGRYSKRTESKDAIYCPLPIYKELADTKSNRGSKWGSTNYRIFSCSITAPTQCHKNASHNKDSEDTYQILHNILSSAQWTDAEDRIVIEEEQLKKYLNVDFLGFNHIIGGSHIELLSSNWLAHYIQAAPQCFSSILGCNEMPIKVLRECENIDILIEYESCVIVIENKINSGIVKDSSGYSCQLEKYYDILKNKENKKYETQYSGKKIIFRILCPDYRETAIRKEIQSIIDCHPEKPNLKDILGEWTIITYSALKKCIETEGSNLAGAQYYPEFIDFLENHSKIDAHSKVEILSMKRLLHRIATCKIKKDSKK